MRKKHKKPERGLVLCFDGPSAAGKDHVVRYLLRRHPEWVFVPRYTTRPLKPGERNGVDYHFVAPAEFARLKKTGRLKGVHHFDGNWYGVDVREIDRHLGAKKRRTVVGIFGRCSPAVREEFGKRVGKRAVLFFITASPAVLAERLRERGELTEGQFHTRLGNAARHISEAQGKFDYVVSTDPDARPPPLFIEAVLHSLEIKLGIKVAGLDFNNNDD
ncbi:MAG: hypothetical protein Q7K39_03345 [Candidatus Magasanikbacteria bacterium]|nr:hypothetical protein [Candidatus Magasanikbacteria bacterium]